MSDIAVIFDMDGVIFDSEVAVRDLWVSMADEWKIPGVGDLFPKCIGCTRERTEEIFKEAYGEDYPYWEFREEASKRFFEKYGGGKLPLKPGIREILAYLKENNVKTALATSTRASVAKRELEDAGLLKYFDEFATGNLVKRSKPDPEIFLLAASMLKVSPANSYVIEDSYNGIRGAKAAGMHPIMVPDMIPANEEMENLAEVILPSLIEVREFLSL